MRSVLIAVVLLLVTPAAAQQQNVPDPAFLQRAIASIENQRNQALSAQVVAEAKAAGLAEELAKANAKIKELESKPAPEK